MTREEKCKLAIEKGYKYNSISGKIYGVTGCEIGYKNKLGYIIIAFRDNGKIYLLKAHIYAWYCTHNITVNCIDHINGDRLDNRILNLRSVTKQENSFNTKKTKGYTWNKSTGKYQAQIMLNNKCIHLGQFYTEQEAHQAYLEAKKIYHKI